MQHDWQPRQEPIRITSHRIARPMNPLVAARKQFFFGKKHQKTFATLGGARDTTGAY
jgi:hypothetical protein